MREKPLGPFLEFPLERVPRLPARRRARRPLVVGDDPGQGVALGQLATT